MSDLYPTVKTVGLFPEERRTIGQCVKVRQLLPVLLYRGFPIRRGSMAVGGSLDTTALVSKPRQKTASL